MGKTVYSLVLSSEVVSAVDGLAARQGFSRSALVNHILAEYASVASPQQQTRQILEAVRGQAANQGLRPHALTAGSLTLRTALNYKYNPGLSYTVELKGEEGTLGSLRVALRSQNEALLCYFGRFTELWALLEERYLDIPPAQNGHSRAPKRYTRALRRPAGLGEHESVGRAIAAYIANLDACLRTFMAACDDAGRAVAETEAAYRRGLEGSQEVGLL